LKKGNEPSLRNWESAPDAVATDMKEDAWVDMGWGRVIFGQTFRDSQSLADILREERPANRDLALYLRDPHVVLSLAPQELFLDPSHTYRLHAYDYRPSERTPGPIVVRRLADRNDANEVNRIYGYRNMMTCDPQFLVDNYTSRTRTYFVAELSAVGTVVGTVTGIDHVEAFGDPENGASLWCLAVDPQATAPGVGEQLTRQLVEHYFARGRSYVDLSVMHDNSEAIRLYEKLGFRRVPVFCLKRKNPFNEPLFTAPQPDAELNPYADIIVNEARRRGIRVEIIDSDLALFALIHGGVRIRCRESLTDLTSAVSFTICDDKRLTRRAFETAGLHMPACRVAGDEAADRDFLFEHGRIVVKPARGEQGKGVAVDVRTEGDLAKAVRAAAKVCPDVLLEELAEGEDLRVIVIDGEVVAAAVRKPAMITGNGRHTVGQLIKKYNRRRAAATGGESRIPLDTETKRCIHAAGLDLSSTVPDGEQLVVRKAANLHTGGTIHDVTPELNPHLADVSVAAAKALGIPVVGLDLIVRDVRGPDYVLIEANERPGLANHEPQPTAEKFIDLLFPQTALDVRRGEGC
jgi:GNAT-family acetyltransferase (TIGR03103 family)